ncbi:MAG: argininosuccinate lyase [Dehalococcoidia bacterium]
MSQDKIKRFVASLLFDRRLYREDIAGSVAHARMLARQGIITVREAELITTALASIRGEIERGEFAFSVEREDIHMSIEARLFEKVGDVAGKLHTARSRNDQIAVDLRLYAREAIADTLHVLLAFQEAVVGTAERHRGVIIPGYTHLRRAQPVLLAHHLLAYFEMAERDKGRFRDCLKRGDVLPLGSGALAGVPYPVDRDFLARELGFPRTSANSLDAVSDRDFFLEYQAAAAITMLHLSRLCEELVLWTSAEFGFAAMPPEYTTGSSIMPQKHNPDVAELVRGKTGRIYGDLVGLLTVMKGLPLSYNRDMQEDKEGFFDTVDTLLSCLEMCAGMVKGLEFDRRRTLKAAEADYALATDVADYLVGKGLPFREAHGAVSRLVDYALSQRKPLRGLGLEEYRRFSPLFKEDVRSISARSSVSARRVPGGTGPRQVAAALRRARRLIDRENVTE